MIIAYLPDKKVSRLYIMRARAILFPSCAGCPFPLIMKDVQQRISITNCIIIRIKREEFISPNSLFFSIVFYAIRHISSLAPNFLPILPCTARSGSRQADEADKTRRRKASDYAPFSRYTRA
jgi:hypothetical protein